MCLSFLEAERRTQADDILYRPTNMRVFPGKAATIYVLCVCFCCFLCQFDLLVLLVLLVLAAFVFVFLPASLFSCS
jgi:hypothetical protein